MFLTLTKLNILISENIVNNIFFPNNLTVIIQKLKKNPK